jgi:hypothetical protein
MSKNAGLLDVKTKSGDIQGFNPILLDLCRSNVELENLVGRTPAQRALVSQWMEYNLSSLWDCSISTASLKELNEALQNSAYFAGPSLTVADVVIYHSLYPVYKEMSFFQKEKYYNLSRWFRLVQEDDKLRVRNEKIIFSTIPLYVGVSHS